MGKNATAAIVVAAGRGTRMGRGRKKQFLELAGVPILAHAALPFVRCPMIDEIYLVTVKDDLHTCQSEIVDRLVTEKPVHVIEGGATRQESVFQGLVATQGRFETVVIHDGVRPFIRPDEVTKTIETARTFGAAIMAIPTYDTVKTIGEDDTVVMTINRKNIRLAQTPQAFRYRVLYDAHVHAKRKKIFGTDDASLVEKQGHPVKVITGSATNIKITTPEDLALAEALIHANQTIKESLTQGLQ